MRPHIYRRRGWWYVCPTGREYAGDPRVDRSRPTFREACHLAMLAAIHAGVWRA